ncbi:MAG: thioredoxin [Planctomycetota bacterium]|jgi:thioredoxin 1
MAHDHNDHKTIYLTNDNFDVVVQGTDLPVLVDFYADWCPPCKAIAPVLDRLAEQFDGQAIIAKVNVDHAQALAMRFGVQSIPTLVFLRNGTEMDRIVGAPTGEVLERKLRDLAADPRAA